MVYTIQQIQQIIAPIAMRYGIRRIYLFGSYARGTADENSDIDLLVDTDGTALTSLFSLGALYSDLEQSLEKPFDLITVSSLTQTPRMPSEADFRDTVMKERVQIYAVA